MSDGDGRVKHDGGRVRISGRRGGHDTVTYYARELGRRLRHYAHVRVHGYPDRGTLSQAAAVILSERSESGLASGGHYRGVWPRDLCFAAPGLCATGHEDVVRETGTWLTSVLQESDVFYTDVHDGFAAATPNEGVDTFPALVCILDECDIGSRDTQSTNDTNQLADDTDGPVDDTNQSADEGGELEANADAIADLAVRHRARFFDDELSLVTGAGSSWWDSAAAPRETYNTAVLLAAIERLEAAGIETTYTGLGDDVRDGLLTHLWDSSTFRERRNSAVLACDANVVPLYFELVDEERARSIVERLETLATSAGLRMRAQPFTYTDVHPFFLLHRDYHYHVWPWNSFMYANGALRYGFVDAATRERRRVESMLDRFGTFLEVITETGDPYVKRGYASAADFTVAAALWTELHQRLDDETSPTDHV